MTKANSSADWRQLATQNTAPIFAAAQQALDDAVAVLAEPQDHVAAARPRPRQRVGEPVDAVVELGPGEADVAVDHGQVARGWLRRCSRSTSASVNVWRTSIGVASAAVSDMRVIMPWARMPDRQRARPHPPRRPIMVRCSDRSAGNVSALYAAGFRPEWREVVADRIGPWRILDQDQRDRLEGLDAAPHRRASRGSRPNGFELTDEIRVTIAAEASSDRAGLPDDVYRGVHAIIVHPTTLVLQGERALGLDAGLVTDEPDGRSSARPPTTADRSCWCGTRPSATPATPERGHNVVFHEFAHKIDMLDGTVDGTPPLATDASCTTAGSRSCTAGSRPGPCRARAATSLGPTPATNAGEFFAVATEVVLRPDPRASTRTTPSSTTCCREFYRQDPLTWSAAA